MDIIKQFVVMAGGAAVATVLLILILANLVLGLIVAVKTKTFRLEAIGEFLGTKVLRLVGGYYVICLVAVAVPVWQEQVVKGALAAVVATFIGFIAVNLKELGFAIPDAIGAKKPD